MNVTKQMNYMRHFIILMIGLVSFGTAGFAAESMEDPVLLRIGDETVTVSEFEEIYRKNNVESEVAESKSPGEYLDMYINFRLKVKEAKAQGMDTVSDFVEELSGYRDQLAQQYLVDNEVTEELIEEAWERSQYDIRASHILLNLNEHAPPEDTLAVYEAIMDARRRILEGESFDAVAREVSDDPSARDSEATANRPARPGNGGDLGYFTVFNMVYPFETAAYNTPVGEISMPFRTQFGYHILKVTNRLPAMGQARVAHIMLMAPQGTDEEELKEKEELIFELHEKLEAGADFGELVAEYSEDRRSAQQDGEMPPFTVNRMVPQFIEAIHHLDEPGDISEPVRTDFGWHIIRLIEKDTPPSYERAYSDLKRKVEQGARSELGRDLVIDRLKDEYELQENRDALKAFYDIVDGSIFENEWDVSKASHLDNTLAEFGEQTLTQKDFAAYLDENQRSENPIDVSHYIQMKYNRFLDDEILAYEDDHLEEKYPEFKEIMNEYHDGMLLFEITDEKVWSKAAADTTGLKTFYDERAGHQYQEPLDEIRGTVIADYQNYLEEQWLEELREKYDVWINREALGRLSDD
ncbi:MAG: peptidylprolyl isomerase [Bacteroidales bacterium]